MNKVYCIEQVNDDDDDKEAELNRINFERNDDYNNQTMKTDFIKCDENDRKERLEISLVVFIVSITSRVVVSETTYV